MMKVEHILHSAIIMFVQVYDCVVRNDHSIKDVDIFIDMHLQVSVIKSFIMGKGRWVWEVGVGDGSGK